MLMTNEHMFQINKLKIEFTQPVFTETSDKDAKLEPVTSDKYLSDDTEASYDKPKEGELTRQFSFGPISCF